MKMNMFNYSTLSLVDGMAQIHSISDTINWGVFTIDINFFIVPEDIRAKDRKSLGNGF